MGWGNVHYLSFLQRAFDQSFCCEAPAKATCRRFNEAYHCREIMHRRGKLGPRDSADEAPLQRVLAVVDNHWGVRQRHCTDAMTKVPLREFW